MGLLEVENMRSVVKSNRSRMKCVAMAFRFSQSLAQLHSPKFSGSPRPNPPDNNTNATTVIRESGLYGSPTATLLAKLQPAGLTPSCTQLGTT